MYEINKEAFAAFLTQQRKEKGWTQKDLADRLFVSDKAVSKWERGLSLPDISLLIPLADCLGVGVAELLEGKRTENPEEAETVEILVKKALSLAEEDPEQAKKARKERALLFGGTALVSLLMLALGNWLLGRGGYWGGFSPMFLYEALGLIFGVYFWCFMKEKLPTYYDENRIGFYTDGFLKINFPGVSFNNTNWPQVVKAFRIWSIVTILVVPLLSILVSLLSLEAESLWIFQMASLVVFLGGLFLPIYLAARSRGTGKKRKWWILLLAAAGLALLLVIPGVPHSASMLEIGSVSSNTAEYWTQQHHMLSGVKSVTLRPKQKEYVVRVETESGTLNMEIQDETGVVFSETEIQTGEYPVSLEGKTKVTVTAERHRGSFAVAPEEVP